MRPQFSIFVAFILAIHFFGFYYTFIFCSIYIKSINGWTQGVFLNFLLDFCVTGFLIPLLITIFRSIFQAIKKCANKEDFK